MRKSFGTSAAGIALLLALLLPCASNAQGSAAQLVAVLSSSSQPQIAAQPTDTPYAREFSSIQLQIQRATAPETAVLLARAFALRDRLDDPSCISKLLESVAADPQQHALVRDDARFYFAQMSREAGNTDAAAKQLERLGFVQRWAFAGPFAAGGTEETLTQPLGPEAGYRDDASFHEGAHIVRWTPLAATYTQAWTSLEHVIPGDSSGAVYVATSVFSDKVQDVALRFSSEAPLAVFVNGGRVFLDANNAKLAFDQHTVPAQLQPGWNALVLKFVRSANTTLRFGMRLTGLHAEQLDAQFALHNADTLTSPDATLAGIQADDLLDIASNVAALDATAHNVETLGLLESVRQHENQHTHVEAAARRSPTPERWLHVAELCGNAMCRYDALSRSLHLNSFYEPAIVALADYYAGRNQKTKARDLLQEALRREPRDFVARDRLIELYAATGLKALALEESRRLENSGPMPLWLKQRMLARFNDAGIPSDAVVLARGVLQSDFTSTDAREILIRDAEQHHNTAALTALYRDSVRADESDPVATERLAELFARTNDARGAEQAYAQAVERAPFDAVLRQSYAALLNRTGERERAGRELAVAAQLNFSANKISEPTTGDSEFLVDARGLAAASRKLHSSDPAVSLADVRIERLQPNGLNSVHVQQVIAINNEQGVRDYAQQAVRFSPESQLLKIVHARVFKADGRQIDAEEDGESPVAESGAAMYYDVRARMLRYPVEAGDVIELDYRLTPNGASNPYGDYFGDIMVFGSSIPQQLKRFVVIAPKSRPLHVVEEGIAKANVQDRDSERVYQWDAHDLAALPNEPRGPALTETAPYVHVSTFGSWQEVGQWYARLVRPQFELDANLRQAADRVLAGKKSELEKITAIQEFVLRQTHYVALEFGIYSYKPYPVTETYARRFGDCKDKASLIVALLRYAGIDAEMALVRTRRLGHMDEDATSIALFNHAIVYVPKYELWLDGTAEYAGLNELPLEDQGAMALTVSLDGKSTLRTIPVSRAEDNFTRRVVRVQLREDGRMQFTGTTYTRGEDAPGLRREYEVAERQRDSVRERLAEVFPTVRVEDVEVTGAGDLQRDVEVNFRGALDTFAGRNSVPLQSSWMPRSFAQSLAVLTERTQDLVLPAPWISEEELHFSLPSSGNVDALPQDTNISSPFGTASLHYERRGRELVVRTSVQFTKLRITPAEYGSFRDFCQQVERAFRSEIKVRLAA